MNEHSKRRIVDGIVRPAERIRVMPQEVTSVSVHGSRRRVLTSSFKTSMALVLVAVCMTGLSFVGDTVSYFNDTEVSSENRLQAGTVLLSISSVEDIESRVLVAIEKSLDGEKNGIGSKEFVVNVLDDEASLPIIYNLEGVLDPENPAGCEMLAIDATFGDYHYNGYLKDFVSPPFTTMGEWKFIVALPVEDSELAPDVECRGKIVFVAGLDGVSDELVHTFRDRKEYDFGLYNWGYLEVSPEIKIEEPAPDFLIPEDTGLTEELGGVPATSSSVKKTIFKEEEKATSTPEEVGTTTESVVDEGVPETIEVEEVESVSTSTPEEVPEETVTEEVTEEETQPEEAVTEEVTEEETPTEEASVETPEESTEDI